MPKFSSKLYELDLGELGYVEGLSISEASSGNVLCRYIGGVPYAQPAERFRAPRPLSSTHRYGSRDKPAKFTGPSGVCPQPGFISPANPGVWNEDCLQLNIWIPAREKPAQGWPVFFYLHGGWLQFGDPNLAPSALAPLLSETAFNAIVVMPAYRLNALGFLASKELKEEADANGETEGNWGFWDQRTALEWTYNHIASFGGNKDNITCAGYSAGAYSTFQQLAHDVYLPKESAIIKRVVMFSNSTGVQARDTQAHQEQFDELLTALNIPLSLDSKEKLSRLRNIPTKQFIDVQSTLKFHEFRPVSDGTFIHKDLLKTINDGSFAKQLLSRGIKILNGECRDEHYCYAEWRPPHDTYKSCFDRLVADYPAAGVQKLMNLRVPDKQLPSWAEDWPDVFGHLYADMQVHDLERGFANCLAAAGFTIGKDLLRYRIEWRAKCADVMIPPEWKVTHATDRAIWFWGYGLASGLLEHEKKILKETNSFLSRFVNGEDVEWEEKGVKMMYRLNGKGEMDMWEDDRWEQGLEGWDAVNP